MKNTGKVDLKLEKIPSSKASLELVLLADPSEEKVASYLPDSDCFAGFIENRMVAVCLVQPRGEAVFELMSIAVQEEFQKSGIGSRLLAWVLEFYRGNGARRLELGTGTFGYQLAFYQRQGFRVTEIDRDFFTNNYDEPIFENGIQLRDMLRLSIDFQEEKEHDKV
ncbi:GNAT family N-acetyltransferase [Spirochaeta dissipatitropha]